MTESEFLALAERALNAIEAALEQATDDTELDVECSRSGNVLEIECIASNTKIIVNSQAPMQQLWLAAKSGGYHYRYDDSRWISTRDGSELYATLGAAITEQAGVAVTLTAPPLS